MEILNNIKNEKIENNLDNTSKEGFLNQTLEKSKNYFKDTYRGLKIGATVALSLGAIEVASAQTGTPNLDKAYSEIESGKTTIEVANNLYKNIIENHKKDNVYIVELSSFKNGLDEKVTSETQGAFPKTIEVGDTLELGSIRGISDFVSVTKESKNESLSEFSQVSKMFDSIEFISEKDEKIEGSRQFCSSIGKTPEEAVASAITMAAGMKKSTVSSLSEKNDIQAENTSNSFVEISTVSADELLHKVKAIVEKSKDGYLAKIYYN